MRARFERSQRSGTAAVDRRAAHLHDSLVRSQFLMLRHIIALALFASAAAFQFVHAEYPERPVRLIVGYAGGDTTDLVARVAAPGLAEFFKQSFIVENHP